MALKDWKKTYESAKIIRYQSAKKKELEIFRTYINDEIKWFVAVSNSKNIKSREIGTKIQARKYAKAYMRKH